MVPIQQSIWKIGHDIRELSTITLPSEDELEEILQNRSMTQRMWNLRSGGPCSQLV